MISENNIQLQSVEVYALKHNLYDVILRKNERVITKEMDNESYQVYQYDEVQFRMANISKELVISNFDLFYENKENTVIGITSEERLQAVEQATQDIIMMTLGGM
jgi:hypothetical protein